MLATRTRQDVGLTLLLLCWSLGEVVAGVVDGPSVAAVPAAIAASGALAWRRRAPAGAALCCAGGLTLQTALGVRLSGVAMVVCVMVAAYSLGRHATVRTAVATAAAMLALTWLALFGLPQRSAGDYLFAAMFVAAPCAAGAALRQQVQRAERLAEQAARAEAQRDRAAQDAVQAERLRIARELHDILAHTVSVMVINAGAVRSRLGPEQADDRAALARSEQAGRQAIGELRRLLDVLRGGEGETDGGPQPTLADLAELVDHARTEGLQVALRISGERRDLDPALEVSAYRVVQEALTNIRKHAHASRAEVEISYAPDALRLQVTDDGRGRGSSGPGYGLLGIRERVELFGGRLRTASPAAGGFSVTADLPVDP